MSLAQRDTLVSILSASSQCNATPAQSVTQAPPKEGNLVRLLTKALTGGNQKRHSGKKLNVKRRNGEAASRGHRNDNNMQHQDNRSRPKFGHPGRERDRSDTRNIECIDTRNNLLNTLTKIPADILMTERVLNSWSRPQPLLGDFMKDERQFYKFHNDHGHDTNSCRELKKETEKAINQGKLDHLLRAAKKTIAGGTHLHDTISST
ncbi:hypothetical protein Tco_0624623 [Tanacetum coccineum]|uniref:Reverse transcriptase domain-containing protein n=1 Tax=Tanacetum coccineum TaxID=301880 RepID=A0ABQ4WEG6_9ASTR